MTITMPMLLAPMGRVAVPSDLDGAAKVLAAARAAVARGFEIPQRLLWDLEDAFEAAAQADLEGQARAAGL